MGLGKTLQTVAFLSTLKYGELQAGGPFLIVAPLSVLSSWMTEFRKWCPTLKVMKLHSQDPKERDRMRKKLLPDVSLYDCIVTTFEMVKSTLFHNSLRRVAFRYLVIDEGHLIKNESTMVARTLRKLKFGSALLLTGTPLQNNMHELWALLNFLVPDVFTDCASFDAAFDLGKSEVDDSMLHKAHYMLRPFLLRRIKEDVEKTVPPKDEIKVFCPLSEQQQFFYKNLLMRETDLIQSASAAVRVGATVEAVDGDGSSGPGQSVTQTRKQYSELNNLLMQLRKCCMHPFLFDGAEADIR